MDEAPCLSVRDDARLRQLLAAKENLKPNSYTPFGTAAGGFTTYGIYSSPASKLYIISAYIENITSWCECE